MKSQTISLLLIFLIITCVGCGTLGSFNVITFRTSKQNLANAIDTLFAQHPEYKIPDKWKSYDDWKQRGYDFLDSRIFYFKSEPEEMYYVSVNVADDSVKDDMKGADISIRAVNNGSSHWKLENETSSSDEKRIEERFEKEIISKLEEYTGTKAIE